MHVVYRILTIIREVGAAKVIVAGVVHLFKIDLTVTAVWTGFAKVAEGKELELIENLCFTVVFSVVVVDVVDGQVYKREH